MRLVELPIKSYDWEAFEAKRLIDPDIEPDLAVPRTRGDEPERRLICGL